MWQAYYKDTYVGTYESEAACLFWLEDYYERLLNSGIELSYEEFRDGARWEACTTTK